MSSYIPIASQTVGAGVSIVTFSSIASNFRDLVLVINGASSSGSGLSIFITLNSDFGNKYNDVNMAGNGSSTSSFSGGNLGASTLFPISTNQGSYIVNFMDYSATDKHKTFLARWGEFQSGDQVVNAYAYRWPSTSAITSITFRTSSGNYAVGATFNLYGIAS
jgi:hypothetical protein